MKIRLWDLFCALSVVGIWPRYIEPSLVKTTFLREALPNLPEALCGFKILQISDLHINTHQSDRFLNKIISKVNALKPDLIVHTGDAICKGQLTEKSRLQHFFSSFKAPYGCYTILGNHDYAQWVSIDAQGNYATISSQSNQIKDGFKRVFSQISATGKLPLVSPKLNDAFVDLLSKTPFRLLHNTTVHIPVEGTYLNLVGLGEYMAGHFKPELAFKKYQADYPGVVLSHNPDTIPELSKYPGDVILCGHTHGAQVNLPYLWNRITLIENKRYKRGIVKENNKTIYINRGLGSIEPFRLFSTPEILLLTLERKG